MKLFNLSRTVLIMGLLVLFSPIFAQNEDATEIVRKSDQLMQGDSYTSIMTMKIVRPSWDRTITFKNWGKGRNLALTYIQTPAADKGQTFLKRTNEMWTWNPKINRLIKLPPSMLAQGWMGSDYTNDDILKESSIVVDYHHKVLREEKYEGFNCWVIQMTPKKEAAVVWGKIVSYIAKEKYFPLKVRYYNDDGDLIKSHLNSEVKKMDDREIPTKTIVQPADDPDKKTVVTINKMNFNVNLQDKFFSQQNMKRIR